MNTEPNEQPETTESSSAAEPQIHAATDAEIAALNAAAAANAQPGSAPTIEGLQAQLADAEKRILIAHADLENFRRRNRREMQDQVRYASLGLMSEILEAVDNLKRAAESYEAEPNGDGLVEGVKLVGQQLDTILENNGCKKIQSVGEAFDPNLHQAIQMQPSDEHPANTVSMEMRSGFQLHDRVVRPSQVFVSTGPENK